MMREIICRIICGFDLKEKLNLRNKDCQSCASKDECDQALAQIKEELLGKIDELRYWDKLNQGVGIYIEKSQVKQVIEEECKQKGNL